VLFMVVGISVGTRTPLKRKPFGDEEIRTPDILLAKQALYQLSYVPLPAASANEAENPLPETRLGPAPRVGTWCVYVCRGSTGAT
jgi:hypothetical protein